jgi:hypothetical protein
MAVPLGDLWRHHGQMGPLSCLRRWEVSVSDGWVPIVRTCGGFGQVSEHMVPCSHERGPVLTAVQCRRGSVALPSGSHGALRCRRSRCRHSLLHWRRGERPELLCQLVLAQRCRCSHWCCPFTLLCRHSLVRHYSPVLLRAALYLPMCRPRGRLQGLYCRAIPAHQCSSSRRNGYAGSPATVGTTDSPLKAGRTLLGCGTRCL